MKIRLQLEQKLKDIGDLIPKRYGDMENIGVLTGISGVAMFQFYYSKYLDVDKHANIGVEMITNCIERINNGYSNPTYCNGISGGGWVIQHLVAEEFIDLNCDELLGPFDNYLYSQMKFDLSNGHYDFLHGAIGYGFYFLKRFRHTKELKLKYIYQKYLLELINELDHIAIFEDNKIKLESVLDPLRGNKGFNLSLSHGISSVINFLTRLYEIELFREPSKKLLLGNINYLLGFENKSKNNLSLFPNWIEKEEPLQYNSRIAWCYGDLGIGLSLMQAGNILNDTFIQQQAVKVLNHASNRKTEEESLVYDAGICHGSYGNAQIFSKLFNKTNNPKYKEAAIFWMDDGIQKAIHNDGFAGYKQWNHLEQNWTPELSLLEGIAGIGLTIIDYLSNKPNTWDECLMIT